MAFYEIWQLKTFTILQPIYTTISEAGAKGNGSVIDIKDLKYI